MHKQISSNTQLSEHDNRTATPPNNIHYLHHEQTLRMAAKVQFKNGQTGKADTGKRTQHSRNTKTNISNRQPESTDHRDSSRQHTAQPCSPSASVAAKMPKRRFQASDITVQAPTPRRMNDPQQTGDNQTLTVTLARYGSAAFCFDHTATQEKLWQAQVDHAGYNNFSFKILQMITEVLRTYDDSKLTDTQALETHHKIRVLNGGPTQAKEDNDPDNMKFVPWRPVFYVADQSITFFLDLVYRIMKHKNDTGQLTDMPEFHIQSARDDWMPSEGLAEPWQKLDTDPGWLPSIFRVPPPRGRRHVLCQIERSEDTHDGEYALLFWGALWVYRDKLDSLRINGGFAPSQDPTEKRTYVRMVKLNDDAAGRERISSILNNGFHQVPIYFVDQLQERDNALYKWLLSFECVIPSPDTF